MQGPKDPGPVETRPVGHSVKAGIGYMGKSRVDKVRSGVKLLFREPGTFFKRLWGQAAAVRRCVQPMRSDYQERLSMTLKDWMIYHHKNVVFKQCFWMGVKTLKNPLDTWVYQEIIFETRPDVLIEIGSAAGGSTLYFAHLFDIMGHGKVVSIDIDRSTYSVKHDRVVEVTGDSSSDEVVAKVAEICEGKKCMILHDGGHRKEQVLADLACYERFVGTGCYIVVEDSVIDLFKPGDGVGQFYEGPLKAAEEFVAAHNDFVVDQERERYILTFSTQGFLKRVGQGSAES